MKLLLLTLSLLSISCAQKNNSFQNTKILIIKDLPTYQYHNIYFSGQPTQENFKTLKKQGFKTIINLRAKSEYDEKSEQALLKKLNLNYYNIPFTSEDELTDEYIESVTQRVKKHKSEGKTLIHCKSGNRVGLWLGGHFFKSHKLSKIASIKKAYELGMKSPKSESKLRKYLSDK